MFCLAAAAVVRRSDQNQTIPIGTVRGPGAEEREKDGIDLMVPSDSLFLNFDLKFWSKMGGVRFRPNLNSKLAPLPGKTKAPFDIISVTVQDSN